MASMYASLISSFNNHPEILSRSDFGAKKNIEFIMGKTVTNMTQNADNNQKFNQMYK